MFYILFKRKLFLYLLVSPSVHLFVSLCCLSLRLSVCPFVRLFIEMSVVIPALCMFEYFLFIHLFTVHLSVWLFVCFLYKCLFVCSSVRLFVCSSVRLSFCMSTVHLFTCLLSGCLSVYLYNWLSVCLSFHLLLYMSVCHSVCFLWVCLSIYLG